MRAVKARLLECLPSCRTFLDVDGNVARRKLETKGCCGTRWTDRISVVLICVQILNPAQA